MRNKVVVISTLAVLAAGELTHSAIASPNVTTSTSEQATNTYIVPVKASSAPQPSAEIAPPENIVTPELSQSTSTPVSTSDRSSGTTATRSASTTNVVVDTKSGQPATPVSQSNKTSGTSATTTNPSVTQPTRTPASVTNTNEAAVYVTNVRVTGATEELQQIVLNAVRTRAGGSTSSSQLNNDVAAILNTGLFANARANTSSNANGLSVVYEVQPVILRSLELSGNKVLTPEVANTIFQSQLGQPLSPSTLRQGVEQLQKWYTDNGYVLAQVLTAQPMNNGVVKLNVAEGVIGNINVRFLDEEGQAAKGRTKEDFIRDEIKLKPGEIFRVDVARQDLQQLYRSGLFNNANIALNGDATNVDVTYELTERPARGVNVGGGYSSDTGVYGTISYNDQNFGGVNKRVDADVQISGSDFQFDTNFTSPYRASNPDTPGYNVEAFRRRTVSRTFDDNFSEELEVGDYEEPREGQFGGGVTLTKPVGEWDASVGVNYTRTSIRDDEGDIIAVDSLGNPLSFSGTGIDDLLAVSAGVSKDLRDNPINPTSGSLLSFNTKQSIPVGSGNILMNQLTANYSNYTPVNLFGGEKSEVLAFNVQGGTTIGDLPPYMAFNLGGMNSVRGYGTGEVASGRSYVLASAEYRIPVFDPVGAVLFADFGTDLGSGDSVPGEPGTVRGKPGTGFGYGAGLRVDSPLGIIRADLGFNDQGDSELQFGIGQRF